MRFFSLSLYAHVSTMQSFFREIVPRKIYFVLGSVIGYYFKQALKLNDKRGKYIF